ncbi:MAG: aldehyde dehydrogenase family protein, partial [Candidatus Gracilibacteria bacterium]|nr:aldehyde dehydrogenase family protein [Candidatus Gracilibacteria bacterium]
ISQKEELAKLDTLEMGMLYKDALGDIEKSASNARFFADNTEKLVAPKTIEDGVKAKIIYEPMGIVFSIMPWNYPFNQALRSVIPNIMAGNTVLMKHASNVPQTAAKIEELFRQAGFPEGVYTNLFIPHDFTEKIIADPRIIGVNVTGSNTVGRQVGNLAGKYLKPSLLELGGSDAFILAQTNDVDKAVAQAIKGRFSNSGQKCNCSKRFFVVESVYEEFVTKFKVAVENLKVGDPMNAETQIGPLAKEGGLIELDNQIQDSIKAGATLLVGGKRLPQAGNFYAPTLLTDVKPGMRVFDEETFGPVAPVIKVKDIKEAVQMANNSKYGLGCSVFGDNEEDLNYVINNIETGNVSVNKIVTSYANLPYGGIKDSGYGKELGENGIKAFTNEKVVVW